MEGVLLRLAQRRMCIVPKRVLNDSNAVYTVLAGMFPNDWTGMFCSVATRFCKPHSVQV